MLESGTQLYYVLHSYRENGHQYTIGICTNTHINFFLTFELRRNRTRARKEFVVDDYVYDSAHKRALLRSKSSELLLEVPISL